MNEHQPNRDNVEAKELGEKISRRGLVLGSLISGAALLGIALDFNRGRKSLPSSPSSPTDAAATTPEQVNSTPQPTEKPE